MNEDMKALVAATLEDGGNFTEVARAVRNEYGYGLRDSCFFAAKCVKDLAAQGHALAAALWVRIQGKNLAGGA